MERVAFKPCQTIDLKYTLFIYIYKVRRPLHIVLIGKRVSKLVRLQGSWFASVLVRVCVFVCVCVYAFLYGYGYVHGECARVGVQDLCMHIVHTDAYLYVGMRMRVGMGMGVDTCMCRICHLRKCRCTCHVESWNRVCESGPCS